MLLVGGFCYYAPKLFSVDISETIIYELKVPFSKKIVPLKKIFVPKSIVVFGGIGIIGYLTS